jgi:predicted dithiol-disulfide oxidoreductase (DUF899 family)
MPTTPTAYPDVASRDEWLAARKKLLAREREVTHLRDAVNAERRRLPMVKVEKDYVFEGPSGEVRLVDMFEGRPQLYIHHFMWIDAIDKGCPSCTMAAELTFTEKDRALLTPKGVTFAAVSRRRMPALPATKPSTAGHSRGTRRATTTSPTTTTSRWIRSGSRSNTTTS